MPASQVRSRPGVPVSHPVACQVDAASSGRPARPKTLSDAIADEAIHRREPRVEVTSVCFDTHEPTTVPAAMPGAVLHDVVTLGDNDEPTPALVRHLIPPHRLEELTRACQPRWPVGRERVVDHLGQTQPIECRQILSTEQPIKLVERLLVRLPTPMATPALSRRQPQIVRGGAPKSAAVERRACQLTPNRRPLAGPVVTWGFSRGLSYPVLLSVRMTSSASMVNPDSCSHWASSCSAGGGSC